MTKSRTPTVRPATKCYSCDAELSRIERSDRNPEWCNACLRGNKTAPYTGPPMDPALLSFNPKRDTEAWDAAARDAQAASERDGRNDGGSDSADTGADSPGDVRDPLDAFG